MLKLHIHPISTNAQKIINLVHYMDLPHERVHVALEKGEHMQDAFRALNPNSKVPVITHGEHVVWESGAIARYLASAFDRSDLRGGDTPAGIAQVDKWLFWQVAHLSPTEATINFTRNVAPMLGIGDGEDTPAVEDALETIQKLAEIADDALSEQAMLSGETITIADILVGTSFAHAPAMRVDLSAHTHLQRWLGDLVDADALSSTTAA